MHADHHLDVGERAAPETDRGQRHVDPFGRGRRQDAGPDCGHLGWLVAEQPAGVVVVVDVGVDEDGRRMKPIWRRTPAASTAAITLSFPPHQMYEWAAEHHLFNIVNRHPVASDVILTAWFDN